MRKRKPTQRANFTKKTLDATKPPAAGRVAVYDSQTRDLGLRIDADGRKTFFWFRRVLGKPVFRTIGSFPATSIDEARGKANEYSGDLDRLKRNNFQGANPFERRDEPTFEELETAYIDRHLKGHAKRPERAERALKWMIDGYLSDWRQRRIGTIRRQDVLDLHDKLGKENGHTTANRVVQCVRRMFYFAEQAGLYHGENPARKIKFFHEQKRTRYLSGEELARLFTALRREPSKDLRDYVLLALFTGARRSDVLGARWQDISLEDNRWTVPDPKNRKPYLIPLIPEAIDILKKRKNGSPYVFPSFGKSGHLVDLKARWQELLKRAKLENLRQHDLRRTLGSWQAAAGSSLSIIGRSLGHESPTATAIYAQLDLAPIRASVTAATTAMISAAKKKPKQLKAAASNG